MSRLFRRAAAVTIIGAFGLAAVAAYAASRDDRVPSAKQQIVDNEAAARATAWRAPKTALAAPAAAVRPPRQAGILDMHQGPFAGSEFAVRNFWQGPVGGRWLLVYAGGPRGSDGQILHGGVRVYTEPTDPNDDGDLTLIGEYDSSTPDALAISAVKRGVASLRSSSRKNLTLTLTTGAFTRSSP